MRAHTKTVVAVAALAGALFLPALASATPTPLVSPALLGVPALPGPVAPSLHDGREHHDPHRDA